MATSQIRLLTTVAVLSLLDPVRVAEDYATLDQLSGGRLDIIIGKGNDPDQNALFGYDLDGQWDRNREKYGLLRRLLREESVSWSGQYRPDLVDATTQPRPFQTPTIPVWHGSASSTESTEPAAKSGDPLSSANGLHPLEKYAALIRHFRERWAATVTTPHRLLPQLITAPLAIRGERVGQFVISVLFSSPSRPDCVFGIVTILSTVPNGEGRCLQSAGPSIGAGWPRPTPPRCPGGLGR